LLFEKKEIEEGVGGLVMKMNIVFGLVNIVTALLLIGISIPLVKHKIKMNHLYGVRITKSFESDDNWYRINAYGGKQLIIWSIPMILAGLICFIVPISDTNRNLLSFVLGLCPITLCVAVAVIKILVYARNL
jgi:hypothetical protein